MPEYTYQGYGSGGQGEIDALNQWYHNPDQPFHTPGQRTIYNWAGAQSVDDWSARDAAQKWYETRLGDLQRTTQFGKLEGLAADAYDPKRIDNIFNIVADNIRKAQGASAGTAGSIAGAHTAQSGTLNPLQTILAARSNASQPYQRALGQAELGRGKAQNDRGKGYFDLMFLIDRARQGDQQAAAELALRQRALEAGIEQGEAGWEDYLGPVIQAGAQIGAAVISSDRRVKKNIVRVGQSPSGINVYEFSYRKGEKRYRGVMAQEVPQASVSINGILHVDYSKIDVPFEVL